MAVLCLSSGWERPHCKWSESEPWGDKVGEQVQAEGIAKCKSPEAAVDLVYENQQGDQRGCSGMNEERMGGEAHRELGSGHPDPCGQVFTIPG